MYLHHSAATAEQQQQPTVAHFRLNSSLIGEHANSSIAVLTRSDIKSSYRLHTLPPGIANPDPQSNTYIPCTGGLLK